MITPPRFIKEEDMVETFKKAGYIELGGIDPDDIFLRKTVRLEDDKKENIDVKIWKSSYHPIVEFFFPSISHKDNSYSKKRVSIGYTKSNDGLLPVSVGFSVEGGRNINYPF